MKIVKYDKLQILVFYKTLENINKNILEVIKYFMIKNAPIS
jgi:hypothetical protein